MRSKRISQSVLIKTKVSNKEKLNFDDLQQIIPDTEIIAVKTRPAWGIEVVTFRLDGIIYEFNYKEIEGKKIYSSLESDDVEKKNIDYYRQHDGIEVITKITPMELLNYLASPKFLSANMDYRSGDHDGWKVYHFAEYRDVIDEVISEKMIILIDKVNQNQNSRQNHWKYGINNRCYDRVKCQAVNQVIELLKIEKPRWVRYDSCAYQDCGCFWIDDGCTMGVFHPDTPAEIIRAAKILSGDTEMVLYLLAVLSGQVSLSGEKIGLSPGNTCSKCGSFLSSGSTRASIHEFCDGCGYSHSTRIYD